MLNNTTLSGAINATQTSFGVAAATNITAPTSTTGAGFTYLYIDAELMFVTGVNGTVVQVLRGQGGTQAVAHGATAGVLIGLPSDFSPFQPGVGAFSAVASNFAGFSAPVASAAALQASGRRFHVTGIVQSTTLLPPAGFVEGELTIVADGIWTWTTGGASPWGFAVAGTVTTAGSVVTFSYDATKQLWYPSRLA